MNKFVPNPNFEAEWNQEQGPETKGEIAEKVLAGAQAVAPVLTGAYQDSLHIQVDGEENVYVVAGVEYGDEVEFGTSDTPTFAPLRRGISASDL